MTMDTMAGREASAQHDAGLRTHMLKVYNYLAGGIGLAAIIAYFVFSLATTVDPSLVALKLSNGIMLTAFGKVLFTTKWVYALIIAPLAFIIVLAFTAHWLGVAGLQVAYWLFVSLMGASLSVIFVVFKLGSITQVFAATSLSFAALSLYGYTTKRDLSGWGTFLYMGLAGVIIAGALNFALHSEALQFVKSIAGVIIFAGFTAYDTQQIKDKYLASVGDAAAIGTTAIWGALNLFLDFVNLLLDLLMLFGRKD